jgi:hypothetical protein
MNDRPRSGGTVFAQVLVAALFLAVIGGSVGLVLGLRDNAGTGKPGADRGSSSPADNQGQGSGQSPSPSDTPGSSASPSGSACPQQAVTAAGQGALVRLLYIQTATSEVWICQDTQGDLFYQGHRGQPGEALVEGTNALFLTQVAPEGDGYVATNPKGTNGITTYHVTRQDLKIDNPGTSADEDQPVLRVLS